MINYDNTSEGFKSHDPYELMIIPPNKKAEMIMKEVRSDKPNLNLVSDLIVLGANLEWEDEDNEGFAPLHLAVKLGGVETVRMLIGAGANVNAHKWGWTPLHWAAGRGKVEIVRMLIDAGARKDIPNEDGKIPYDLTTNQELKNLLKS
jgi:ankyrin repeat protein